MLIKKYKAVITGTETQFYGYISENRKCLGNGCYSDEIEYIISVTEFSMPNSIIRGCFKVKKESIEPFLLCPICQRVEVIEKYKYTSCSEECYGNL